MGRTYPCAAAGEDLREGGTATTCSRPVSNAGIVYLPRNDLESRQRRGTVQRMRQSVHNPEMEQQLTDPRAVAFGLAGSLDAESQGSVVGSGKGMGRDLRSVAFRYGW
ncbi:hypothetical protein K439DRAFT_1632766 [Ramaria rubella]|nr:hypothetical protein K439DRAFT_1632766 [Ramaria rubella]